MIKSFVFGLLTVLFILTPTRSAESQPFRRVSDWDRYQYNPTENGGVRYCNNPDCVMCNRIFGPMAGFVLTPEHRSIRIEFVRQTPNSKEILGESVPLPSKEKESALRELLYGYSNEEDIPILEPSSVEAVRAMLNLVKPNGKVIYDLGCGDGRILALATKDYGAKKGVGIELNIDSVIKANELADMMGVKDKVTIKHGDLRDFNYDEADIIALYLFPDLLDQIVPKVKKGTIVISYGHDLIGVKTQKHVVNGYEFFVWTK